MKIKPEILWKGYFLFYCWSMFFYAAEFFKQDSPISLYYHILMAYDIVYLLPYCLNALAIFINLLGLVPYYLFIQKKTFLSFKFWKIFFFIRLALDLTTRSYELNHVKSYLRFNKTIALLMVLSFILFNIPSYWSTYQYAFRMKK